MDFIEINRCLLQITSVSKTELPLHLFPHPKIYSRELGRNPRQIWEHTGGKKVNGNSTVPAEFTLCTQRICLDATL